MRTTPVTSFLTADEVIEDVESKTTEEIAEIIIKKENKARDVILEGVGDMSGATSASVLFV